MRCFRACALIQKVTCRWPLNVVQQELDFCLGSISCCTECLG